MDDERQDEEELPERRPRPGRGSAEGVRIIGAEEAAAALEAGAASGRQPRDVPRFGDVPPPPAGPRPAHRFPLPESQDPAEAVPRPPVISSRPGREEPGEPGEPAAEPPPPPTAEGSGERRLPPISPPGGTPSMPHWSEPPTGEVPSVLAGDDEEADAAAWASFRRAPRWRDSQTDWEEPDFDDTAALADDEIRQGALAPDRGSDLFSFEEDIPSGETEPVVAPPRPARRPRPEAPPPGMEADEGPPTEYTPPARDVPTAVAIGLVLAAIALLCFRLGPGPSMVLSTVVVLLAAVEVYDVLRRAGYRPATLLGLAATASIMLAAYNYGETAIPLVVALTTGTTFLWFLFGVERARPTVNVAVTLGAFLWVGVLGSFAALLLTAPNRWGIAWLLGAVLTTVANDVGALAVGRQWGTRPLAPHISPNKTWEGVVGGGVVGILVAVLVLGWVGMEPWDVGKAFWLGVVVAVVAPVGDLCESMIKRDIGVKDMGTLLPGHGGVLDRFDSILFTLPATYYLVQLLYF